MKRDDECAVGKLRTSIRLFSLDSLCPRFSVVTYQSTAAHRDAHREDTENAERRITAGGLK